ncbi:MAG: DUF5110 domain-containing protein, partial [Clostridia bacterium]|nr:DUF5110 domain-containing protein [Clostridia bacterium]
GFSGDTVITWKSLNFQPYFTANAANAGYSWWSHDIGGHCLGNRDDELYIRWVQLGVFSPVMRLHSTSNEFSGKEPWKYNDSIGRCAKDYLSLRHKLIPYIYTMNRRTNKDGIALCEPMYYSYQENSEAYCVPNEFFFGSEIICAPVTEKADKKTGLAPVKVWLPRGRYTDILTGRIYEGGKYYTIYRDITKIPLFAREGAIIPLSSDGHSNNSDAPAAFDILIYRGNNTFTLYEDDGETFEYKNGHFAETDLQVKQIGTDLRFTVNALKGDKAVIPAKRDYKLMFKDIVYCEKVFISYSGKTQEVNAEYENGTVIVNLKNISPSREVQVMLKRCTPLSNVPYRQAAIETVSRYQLPPDAKMAVFGKFIDENASLFGPARYIKPLQELRELKY